MCIGVDNTTAAADLQQEQQARNTATLCYIFLFDSK